VWCLHVSVEGTGQVPVCGSGPIGQAGDLEQGC
jgi:hypothetical protein